MDLTGLSQAKTSSDTRRSYSDIFWAGVQRMTGLLCLLAAYSSMAHAQSDAKAASGPPYQIAVLVNSGSAQPCYDDGIIDAIKKMTALAQEEINKSGGVHGRPIHVRILDDGDQAKKTVANIREALKDKQLLAVVGLSSDFLAVPSRMITLTLGARPFSWHVRF